jgi:hypothetical protein
MSYEFGFFNPLALRKTTEEQFIRSQCEAKIAFAYRL